MKKKEVRDEIFLQNSNNNSKKRSIRCSTGSNSGAVTCSSKNKIFSMHVPPDFKNIQNEKPLIQSWSAIPLFQSPWSNARGNANPSHLTFQEKQLKIRFCAWKFGQVSTFKNTWTFSKVHASIKANPNFCSSASHNCTAKYKLNSLSTKAPIIHLLSILQVFVWQSISLSVCLPTCLAFCQHLCLSFC